MSRSAGGRIHGTESVRPGSQVDVKILFSLQHAGFLKHFESALGVLCNEGHSVHLAFHTERKVDVAKATQQFLTSHQAVTVSQGPRRSDALAGFAFKTRALRNYLMYFDARYLGKDRLKAAAAAELDQRDRKLVERLVAIPGMRHVLDRMLYVVERSLPTDPAIDAFIKRIEADVVLVSPLVPFNSPQVDYIKSARALGIPSALCVASWDNLTNKGQMRELPDRVTVWNAAQVEEAVAVHRYPRDRVVVTGAQTFDDWFRFRPSRSKEAFLAERGFRPGTALLLYLCSSTSIAPQEIDFIAQWQEAVRNAPDPRVTGAAILVRPHPNNEQPWGRLDALALANFAVWPRDARGQFEPQWQNDYFDSMYHADAVVGLNTSGMIEAGLIGKPVLTVLSKDIPATLQGTTDTLHFDYLLNVSGGLLHVASSWEEHARHLARAIDGDPAMAERSRAFTQAFIRPNGMDKPATPMLAEAIRSLPSVRPRSPWWERILCDKILRFGLKVPFAARTYPRRILRRLYSVGQAALGRYAAPVVVKFPRVVPVDTLNGQVSFLCYSKREVRRTKRFFSKEPGTIEWLVQTLRPDDIFFDIGANIGAYSIFAAREITSPGGVYAFEPHLANAASLLQNVSLNGLAQKIQVISIPLTDRDGFGPFHYHSLDHSRSHSQFGPPVLDGQTFRPVATELKFGACLDTLIESGIIPSPTVVKIDVDGLEAEIIAGMSSLLKSSRAPRSIQVELSRDNADKVISQMAAAGYQVATRHWTSSGQDAIRGGVEPLGQFPHNIVFDKVTVAVERRPADLSLVQTR
jgi:FkbM family methyltransferase